MDEFPISSKCDIVDDPDTDTIPIAGTRSWSDKGISADNIVEGSDVAMAAAVFVGISPQFLAATEVSRPCSSADTATSSN